MNDQAHRALDGAVAQIDGWKLGDNPIQLAKDEYVMLWEHPGHKMKLEAIPPYSTDWAWGGPVWEKHKATVMRHKYYESGQSVIARNIAGAAAWCLWYRDATLADLMQAVVEAHDGA